MEIEAKVKVDCLEAVAGGLRALGAEDRGQVTHIDAYYADAHGDLLNSGSGLRLRRERREVAEKVILTYKGTKEKGRFKKRREIEVEIAEYASMDKVLSELGYRKELVIEKHRKFWGFKGCAICLDEVPLLGCFVEVEGPDEDVIEEVLGDIGLGGHEHIRKGYAGLMRRRLKEMNSDKREVLFEVE